MSYADAVHPPQHRYIVCLGAGELIAAHKAGIDVLTAGSEFVHPEHGLVRVIEPPASLFEACDVELLSPVRLARLELGLLRLRRE